MTNKIEEKLTIVKKLALIQSELKAPKGQFNNFGKYKYRSCEDILEAVKPIIHKYGCIVTLSDELVNIGERYYIKATVTINDGEGYLNVTAYSREEEAKKGMDGSQVTGAASSYARKYALNGLFCIDDTKDSDATNTHGKSNNQTPSNSKIPFEVSDSSASKEEINNAINIISCATNTEELKSIWVKLPSNIKSVLEVEAKKNEMKESFS